MNSLELRFEQDSFTIEAEDDSLLVPMASVFEDCDLHTDRLLAQPGARHIGIRQIDNGYEIVAHGRRALLPTYASAAGIVMQMMSDSFVGHASDQNLVMHAATCALHGKAVVFAGRSGAGKTSLAVEFARHGSFLGDECAHVSIEDGTVWHEPFPFQLKRVNNDLLAKFADAPKLAVGEPVHAYYLPRTVLPCAAQKRLPIGWIVFPSFRRKLGPTTVKPVEGKRIPELLLESSIGESAPSIVLGLLLKMLGTYQAHLLCVRYTDVHRGALDLLAYLEEQEEQHRVKSQR